EEIDAGSERLWPEGDAREREVAAVAAAHDRHTVGVDAADGAEVAFGPDEIVEIGFAVVAVILLLEGLPVAARAAVVHREHDVAVIDQILDERVVAYARLAAGAAMNPEQRGRSGRAQAGLLGTIEVGRNLHAVVRREP